MKLVVDANILIAALLKNATTREILLKEDMEFFAPEHLLNELKHILKNPKIRRRFHLSDEALYELASAILSRIQFVPEKIFSASIKRALPLVAHSEDTPYLGLSLAFKHPLWSNDFALKEQSLVKIYTTYELVNILEASSS